MKVSLRRRAACNGNSDKKHKTFTFSFSLLPWPAQPLFRVYEAAVIRNAMMGNCAILFIQKLVGGHAKIAHEACCYLCHCHSIYTDHVTDSEPQSTESADSPFPHARLSKYFNSGSAPSNRCGDCSDDDGGQDPPCQPAARHVSSTAGPRSDALTPSAFEFPASEFCITADEDEEKEDNKGTYQMRKESSFKNDLTLCRSLHPSIHNSCCTKIGCLYISLGHVWRLLLLAHPAVTRGRL